MGRLLFFAALVEIVAATVRAVVDPNPTPAVLGHLAGFVRMIYAVSGVVMATRFVPLARTFGLQLFAFVAIGFFALSAVFGLAPFLDIVPESMTDDTWDALLQILRAVTFVAGTSMTLLVARAFAQRESQRQIARHLAWTLLPLVACLPVAFQAIDPALVPSPWLGPGLALALPIAMVLVGLMRWDIALWSLLGLLALGSTVMFQPLPGALTLPALAAVGVFLLAAVSTSGALHELAPSFERNSSEGVSRTLLRRLFDGTLGGEGSRVGDLDPDASKPPPDEKAEDAEQLARTYRELGIEPNAKPVVTAEEGVMLAVIQPLVPISRSAPRPIAESATPSRVSLAKRDKTSGVVVEAEAPSPASIAASEAADDGRLAPVVVLPVAWTGMYEGLKWCFGAFISRVIVVVFGLMWSSSPLGSLGPAIALFDLGLLASSAAFARGLYLLWRSPLVALRVPATLAAGLGLTLAACDLTLIVLRVVDADRTALLSADALIGVAAVAGFLVTMMRLNTHLRQPKLRTRARGSLVMLSVWSVFATGTVVANHLPASDLQWLSWPLGFATAAVGMGLWIALLWLTRDTQEALRP